MRIVPCLLLVLAPSLLWAQGLVSPLDQQSAASISVSVTPNGTDFYSETSDDFTLLNGTTIASAASPEVFNNQNELLLRHEGFLTSRTLVVRDEGHFMRFVASCNMDLFHEKLAAQPGDLVEITGNGSVEFDFEITGGPMPYQLDWDDFSSGGNFDVYVSLTRDGDSTAIYVYPAPPGESNPGKVISGILDPGTYAVQVSMGNIPDSGPTLRKDVAFHLAVGEEPDEIPLPPQGDYTHPDIVTARSGEGILQVLNPTLLSELSLGDGTTEIVIAAHVENLRAAPWPEVVVSIPEQLENEPDLEVISLPSAFSLDALQTLPLPDNAIIRVNDSDLAEVKASLLDGSRFRLEGLQQPVFAYPVYPLNPRDLENPPQFSPLFAADSLFSLPYVPPTPSGTVWMEWEPFYREPLRVVIDNDPNPPFIARIQGLDRDLPVMIGDVVRSGSGFQIVSLDPDDPLTTGGSIGLHQFMKEGQMISSMFFEGHPEGLPVTEDPEGRYTSNGLSLSNLFPSPVPFHFNQFEVSPGVKVSGSFNFRPKDLIVNFEMSNFQLEALEVTTHYTADCNLLLETAEGADNSAEPIAGREGTLLDLPLMDINLSNGLRFTPRLVLEAGALVTAPTSLSIPVTAGLDIMVMAGVRDGQPSYDSAFTPIPVQVSDPSLYEALAADATAYIDCEIKAFFSGAGTVLQTGPTLGARAQAGFTFQPLLNPWWTAQAELSIFAGVELDLANLVTLFDPELTLTTADLSPLFPSEAEGGLAGGDGIQSFNPQPGFQPLGGIHTRWARSLQSDTLGEVASDTAATLLSNGDLLASNIDVIARLSPAGELLWAMDTNRQLMAGAVVAEPDGGFTALGIQSDFRLARFDSAGAEIWKIAYRGGPGIIWREAIDLVRTEDAGGAAEYLVLGEIIDLNNSTFLPAVVKLDAAGQVIWAKHYNVPPLVDESVDTDVTAIGITAEGDILLAGNTTADMQSAGTNANITRHAVVFKVDGATGDPLWTTLIAFSDGPSLFAVSEGPAGSVYAGGKAQGGVTSEHPALLLIKLNPDGSLLDSIRIGSAESADNVPHGGESIYDEIRDMTWVDGNLWICGQIGLFNVGSASAQGASAFTAMVSPGLDVTRFAIHAGPSSEFFNSIEATPYGLFVTGFSQSFHPWPRGASDQNSTTPGGLLAMMLPWEGRILFHEISAGRQLSQTLVEPKGGSYFVTPRIRAASQFTIETNQSLFPGLSQDNLTQSGSVSRMVTAQAFTPEENTIFTLEPVFIEPVEFKSMEFIPESLITDFSTYLQYWQVDPGQDTDNDNLTSEMEYFLGTSGLNPDFGVIDFESFYHPVSGELHARFIFPRAQIAAPSLPVVHSGSDLIQFDPRADVSAFSSPLDDTRDEITLELPVLDTREFYQLHFPQ